MEDGFPLARALVDFSFVFDVLAVGRRTELLRSALCDVFGLASIAESYLLLVLRYMQPCH